jgi:hypothetical protein
MDMVSYAHSSSYSGSWGRKISWVQEFKASLGEIQFQNKNPVKKTMNSQNVKVLR